MTQLIALKFTNPSSSSFLQFLTHNSHVYRLLIILRSLLSLVPRAHVSTSRQPRDSASPKPAVPSHVLFPFSILTRPHGLNLFKPLFCFLLARKPKMNASCRGSLSPNRTITSSYISHLLTLLPIQNAAPSPLRRPSLNLWLFISATATNAVANPPPRSAALPSSPRSLYRPPLRGL